MISFQRPKIVLSFWKSYYISELCSAQWARVEHSSSRLQRMASSTSGSWKQVYNKCILWRIWPNLVDLKTVEICKYFENTEGITIYSTIYIRLTPWSSLGELTYTYKLDVPHSTADVKFHPHDNFVAVAAFGSARPITFFRHSEDVTLPPTPGMIIDVWSRLVLIKLAMLTFGPTFPISRFIDS